MQDLIKPIDGSNKIAAYTLPLINPVLQSDTDPNNSDKTIIVPDNKIWKIITIRLKMSTTGTSGNRHLLVTFTDDNSNEIFRLQAEPSHSSSRIRYYSLFNGAAKNPTVGSANTFSEPLPNIILPPGFGIRIYDYATIDPTGDDLEIHILVNEIPI